MHRYLVAYFFRFDLGRAEGLDSVELVTDKPISNYAELADLLATSLLEKYGDDKVSAIPLSFQRF